MKSKQIRRSIFAILMIAVLLFAVIPIGASAVEVLSDFECQIGESGDEKLIWLKHYIGNEKQLVIPEEIDGMKIDAINAVEYLISQEVEEIYISKSVRFYIGAGLSISPCENSNLKSIVVSNENQNLSSSEGVLYNKDMTSMLCYPVSKKDTTFTIPRSVNTIIDCVNDPSTGELSFYGNKYLKTLYVYDNTYGLEWAKSHDFPYVIIDEPQPPIEKEIVDSKTGVKVNGLMDNNAVLNVEILENTLENSVSTYDITLKKDGNTIQPNGTITITIPAKYGDCNVFWIKDDGTKADMNAKYTDGNYVFTTDHLSVYALVREAKPIETVPTDSDEDVTTATKADISTEETTSKINPTASPNATSKVSTKDTATKDSVNKGVASIRNGNSDNGTIQTGAISIAVILFVLLASLTTGGFVWYRRKIK